MATSSKATSNPRPNPTCALAADFEDEEFDADDLGEEEEEEEEEEDDDDQLSGGGDKARMEAVVRRITAEEVRIRVHGVEIRGNVRTRRAAVEAALGGELARAATVRDLVRAAAAARERLRRLGAFDDVAITLDAGPPGAPGNAVVVVVDVAEARSRVLGDLGIYAHPETRSCSVEASVKLKNLFGYCDTWDTSSSLGLDQTTQLSAGVSVPRIGAIPTPLTARLSLLSQDLLKSSSCKEHLMGVSFGLLSTMRHDLVYNLTWRTLTDPSRISSKSIREQLGHSLLSSIKYTYKIDRRDSSIRPMHGYAFLTSSQVGGLAPDSRNLRFFRQEFDVRVALPLGTLNGALNVGATAAIIMPLGRGSTELASPLPERFYLGGNSSLVCRLGGPSSLLGFKTRGLGPATLSSSPGTSENEGSASPGRDALGGDIAVTTFADLSFDLPLKPLRELGIHGHVFVSAGNLAKLKDSNLRNFSSHEFLRTFRSSTGFGVVVPTKFFRMEVNYCHILKQFEHDRGKTGIQFNFSSP